MTDSPETPRRSEVRTASGPAPFAMPGPGPDGFDPFAKMFGADGLLDQTYVRKRIPALVDLLRHHPGCFPLRIDHDELAQRLMEPDGEPLRSAADEAAFERALAEYSRSHLHELVADELVAQAREVLRTLTLEIELNRRQRVAAAIGVVLLAGVPDGRGLRGRAIFDLVMRVTLEELHAQEQMRKSSRETEGGLSQEELETFWTSYPALRHRFEQRYRREVTHVIEQIEDRNFPMAVSLDMALRGTAALMARVRQHAEEPLVAGEPQEVLREPFQSDLLDGGRETLLARWASAAEQVRGASRDRRAYVRAVETAIRIVQAGGPGADVILFAAYLHAIAQGNFHVDDPEEAEVARTLFDGKGGLVARGVLDLASLQEARGHDDAARRLLMAALEIWPDDEDVRLRVKEMGEREMEQARARRQGPAYDEDQEPGGAATES